MADTTSDPSVTTVVDSTVPPATPVEAAPVDPTAPVAPIDPVVTGDTSGVAPVTDSTPAPVTPVVDATAAPVEPVVDVTPVPEVPVVDSSVPVEEVFENKEVVNKVWVNLLEFPWLPEYVEVEYSNGTRNRVKSSDLALGGLVVPPKV